ncbi:M3 family metallopeptidase [Rubrimonas sp.]|uniref:M3 family metallopeptidase n=1 Tax=Rubrimonas sp. TaxID=2036015 RepID=UPI002FDD9F0C
MTDPLRDDWTGPHGLPDFSALAPEQFEPVFAEALAAARVEIAAIASDPAAPDFANTVEALERSGRALDRVCAIFFTLAGAHTSPEIEAIQTRIAPELARFTSETLMNAALFARVDALWTARDALPLNPEQARVLELTRRRFVRAGAQLDAAGRARMAEIMQRLAALGVKFGQNVLADERDWALPLAEADLAGLPDFLRDAAASAARARGLDGWCVTLSRSLIEPFLQFSERRDLREQAWRAWVSRGEQGETDNRAIVAETLTLRRERAQLLGYPDYPAFKLEPEMAKTPQAARELLMRVWAPARARAAEEADKLRALIAADGANHPLEPWDWRFYAEKLRAADYDLSDAELKPYLTLDGMIAAAFDAASRLFGLSFREIEGATLWHEDVRSWEVLRGGGHLGVFVGDYFNRASKRSGAWCSSLQGQRRLDGPVAPIAVNVMNFAKASDGPTLLTFDDAETLFHEFGHALHVLLSDVTYPSISGTSVARDFVELPSQLYEHWLSTPEILGAHARHVRTGAPMPQDLIDRLRAARGFNQGFSTVEFVASALVDLDLHEADDPSDPLALEAQTLARIGMPPEIAMRHRTAHFQHVFSGEGYASGYYSYMWSEVMDADAFAAFEEAGDPFDPATAERLRAEILSVGGSRDADAAWTAFRGRAPDPQAMLVRRGLAAA